MRVQVNKKELGHKPQERGKGNLQGKKSQDDRDSTGVKGNWSNGSRSESAGKDFFRKMNLRQYVMQLVHLRIPDRKSDGPNASEEQLRQSEKIEVLN